MPTLGITELVIISAIIVLLVGAKKLPALGGAIGESIKNFKKGIHEEKKLPDGEKRGEGSDEKKDV